MNIAFPFLVLMLLMGPGFVFRTFSQRREVRNSEAISVSRATFSAFVSASVINATAVAMANVLGFEVRLGDMLMILANDGHDVVGSSAEPE